MRSLSGQESCLFCLYDLAPKQLSFLPKSIQQRQADKGLLYAALTLKFVHIQVTSQNDVATQQRKSSVSGQLLEHTAVVEDSLDVQPAKAR